MLRESAGKLYIGQNCQPMIEVLRINLEIEYL